MSLMIIGLGNPMGMYPYRERNNMGFMVADMLVKNHNRKFMPAIGDILAMRARVPNGKGDRAFIVKPQMTMSRSGEAIAEILRSSRRQYPPDYDDFIIVQDDMNLEPGRINIVRGETVVSHHPGVQSVMDALNRNAADPISTQKNLIKVKVGIGEPTDDTIFYWLTGELDDGELAGLMPGVTMASKAIEDYIQNGNVEAIMDKYNDRKPARRRWFHHS